MTNVTVVNFGAGPPPDVLEDDISELLKKEPYARIVCEHVHTLVDERNRIVTCRDCKRELNPFDVLCQLADRSSRWRTAYKAQLAHYEKLRAYKPHLIDVRTLEGIWRGGVMLPTCPRCHKGVELKALANGGRINRAFATRLQEVEEGRQNGALADQGREMPAEAEPGAPDPDAAG